MNKKFTKKDQEIIQAINSGIIFIAIIVGVLMLKKFWGFEWAVLISIIFMWAMIADIKLIIKKDE
jgi:hypothetical protein